LSAVETALERSKEAAHVRLAKLTNGVDPDEAGKSKKTGKGKRSGY
jgi:hypothetical protein